MSNKVDHAIARAITQYSQECEAKRISRDTAEQRRRIAAALDHADPLDVLASDYFGSLTTEAALQAMRTAVLSRAGRSVSDEEDAADEPAPKPRKSKKKDAE